MCQKLEQSKWEEDAADSQADSIYLFNVGKDLEIVEYLGVSQIESFISSCLQNHLCVFDNYQNEVSCQVGHLKKVCDPIDADGKLE